MNSRPSYSRSPPPRTLAIELQKVGLLEANGGTRSLGRNKGWASLGRYERGGLQALGDLVRGLENEESFSPFAQFHGIFLLDAVDLELNLLLVGAQKREFAEANVEGGAVQVAILLLDYYDIDGTAEGGGIDGVPGGGHGIADISDVLHGSRNSEAKRPCYIGRRQTAGDGRQATGKEGTERERRVSRGRERGRGL